MLFKHRKHSRYNVQDGTFVIVAPGEQKVQIIDISMGGAAFIYQGRPEDLEASGALKLIAEEMSLQKLKFDTVSDVPAPGYAQSLTKMFRRRGVQFKWIGVLEEAELNKFIKEVGIFTA
jgi:hypothetical protein